MEKKKENALKKRDGVEVMTINDQMTDHLMNSYHQYNQETLDVVPDNIPPRRTLVDENRIK